MFIIHGGSVARPRAQPRQPSRVPWLKILFGVAILVAFGTAIAVANNSASNRIYQEQVSLAPADSEASGLEPQTVPAATIKEYPVYEPTWAYKGGARIGDMEAISKLSYPLESRLHFISGDALKGEWSFFTEHAHGYVEGNAGCAFVSDEEVIYCTPDKGRSWVKVPNLRPQESLTQPKFTAATVEGAAPKFTAAVVEGDTLVLYIALQVQPLVYGHWRAEIPLATLEGLSP